MFGAGCDEEVEGWFAGWVAVGVEVEVGLEMGEERGDGRGAGWTRLAEVENSWWGWKRKREGERAEKGKEGKGLS